MRLFSRREPAPATTVDMDAARRAGEAVNRGDLDEADRIVQATSDPQAHALAAFRYIDLEEN